MADKENKKSGKSGIIASLGAVAISVLGWLYGLSINIFEYIKTIYNNTFGEAVKPVSGSDFEFGKADANDGVVILVIAAAFIILTLLGVIGLIGLFKRLFGKKN